MSEPTREAAKERSDDLYRRLSDGVDGVLANLKRAKHQRDRLVTALETARRDLRDYGAAPIQQVREELQQALEEAKA